MRVEKRNTTKENEEGNVRYWVLNPEAKGWRVAWRMGIRNVHNANHLFIFFKFSLVIQMK